MMRRLGALRLAKITLQICNPILIAVITTHARSLDPQQDLQDAPQIILTEQHETHARTEAFVCGVTAVGLISRTARFTAV
jgi:hypothetical protein